MSLLVYNIPDDKLKYVKEQIDHLKSRLLEISGSSPRVEMEERIKKLEQFLTFLGSQTSQQFQIFEMTNRVESGASANIDIFFALAGGGGSLLLQNEDLKAKFIDFLYQKDDPQKAKAYFNKTGIPFVFEWWEKEKRSNDDILRGLIKISGET